MKKNIDTGFALDFFLSIPDDLLIQIAEKDWESLKRLCDALTLDIQLLKEQGTLEENERFSDRRNLC